MTFTKEHKTHHLKIYPEHFSAVLTGVKRAELRKNDRDFKVGDTLHLMETQKGSCKTTGEFVNAVITHIADVGDWLPGYVLLSIERETVNTVPPAPVVMKDHQMRELVNELRDIAVEYHGTQQLRERIARTIRAALLQGKAEPVSQRDVLNSPAAPDGWVLVPVEPTAAMMVAGTLVSEFHEDPAGMYRAMIEAAPRQEVK